MNDSMLLLGAGLVFVVGFRSQKLLVQSIFRRRGGHEAFNETVLDGSIMCDCRPAYRTFVEQRRNKAIPFRHGDFGA
jgi:hypothetical protein